MTETKKRIIWAIIFVAATAAALFLSDRAIFPKQNVETYVERKGYSAQGRPETYTAKTTIQEANSMDILVRIGLVIVAVIAYWPALGLLIKDADRRFIVYVATLIAVLIFWRYILLWVYLLFY